MRLFTAIDLPDAVREHLVRLINRKDAQECAVVSWGGDYRVSRTRPENLHVTLKFLGEVDEAAVPPLCDALGTVTAQPSEEVWVGHAELLPPRGPVRIIAAGLDGDVGRIELLFRAVEARCDEQGFPRERRAYRPHITMQRCRDPLPTPMRNILTENYAPLLPGPRFRVESFALFESRLLPDAPQCIRLAQFPLTGAAGVTAG
jgi:2'-5' RNA ligase